MSESSQHASFLFRDGLLLSVLGQIDLVNALFLSYFFTSRYEISNFARAESECVHNTCYWRGDQYIGLGNGEPRTCALILVPYCKHEE